MKNLAGKKALTDKPNKCARWAPTYVTKENSRLFILPIPPTPHPPFVNDKDEEEEEEESKQHTAFGFQPGQLLR